MYGTLNNDESEFNRGFQGVLKIASFNNGNSSLTQGTGFYGLKEGFKPITDLRSLDQFFKRKDNDFGTDKFILGFVSDEDWKNTVIEESVSNYMWAILNEKIEITVDDILINKRTLKNVIDSIKNINPKSRCLEFYLTLTSDEAIELKKEFKTEEDKTESMRLYLMKDENFSNRISLIRGTGMKIYEKGHFRTAINFAGTLVVEGEKLNEALRKMEPPTHDDWKPGLYKDNKKYAEKLKKDLYKWLREEVNNIAPKFDKESLELAGMQNILPSLGQEESPLQEVDLVANNEELKSLTIVSNSMTEPTKKKKHKRLKNKQQTEQKPVEETQKKLKSKSLKAQVKNIRAFCLDHLNGLYRVIINTKKEGEAYFEVKLIGESISEVANIYSVIDSNTKNNIEVNGNIIGPISLLKNKNTILTVSMGNETRYSLEVIPNEIKN